jgi:hypothetical protein
MSADGAGAAVGFGGGGMAWSGPRDFNSSQYGPSSESLINTMLPFKVSASFPTTLTTSGDIILSSIDMLLQQDEKEPLKFSLTSYQYANINGFVELTTALQQGQCVNLFVCKTAHQVFHV